MTRGTIKRLIRDRGFGFITPEGARTDLFFHSTAVEGVSFDQLSEGQQVEFDVTTDPRRQQERAEHVRLV